MRLRHIFLYLTTLYPSAYAAGQDNIEGLFWNLIPLGLLGAFYIFFIRPQQKEEEQIKQMQNQLEVKTEIMTQFGVIGIIVALKNEWVKINVGNDHCFWIQRKKVRSILPKGTLSELK
jgi:preprotein translocase subunit YajC